jgi:small subunit ribosomal protein S9
MIKEENVLEKNDKSTYYEAIGRRRESTARVRLYIGHDEMLYNGMTLKKGEIWVNKRNSDNYFPGEINKKLLSEPFRTTNTLNRFIVIIKTSGGGSKGQLGAVILGLSRALEKIDKEKYRPILKKRKFLTRDSRIKQRRKAGFAGKSRAKKQSPKR